MKTFTIKKLEWEKLAKGRHSAYWSLGWWDIYPEENGTFRLEEKISGELIGDSIHESVARSKQVAQESYEKLIQENLDPVVRLNWEENHSEPDLSPYFFAETEFYNYEIIRTEAKWRVRLIGGDDFEKFYKEADSIEEGKQMAEKDYKLRCIK